MRLIFTGNGKAGSYWIRADQIGEAMGQRVKPAASLVDFRQVDAVVVVKRVPGDMLLDLRASGKPWVLDVLDFYPQPLCTGWSKDEAVSWCRDRLANLRPTAVIWPNARMMHDVGFDGPQKVIPHHHRPGVAVNPIRRDVRTVGYEGAASYLDGWRDAIELECRGRGWTFVVNPERLADVDIVLALRDPAHNGYAQRHWKSNVKLANAHGSGTPFIGGAEDGYLETSTGAEYWADSEIELHRAFDWLIEQGAREAISDRFLSAALPVEKITPIYEELIRAL